MVELPQVEIADNSSRPSIRQSMGAAGFKQALSPVKSITFYEGELQLKTGAFSK